MAKQHSLMKLAPLFLVLFIDGMGLGLLFPIINSIIIDSHSAFLSQSTSMAMRDFYYGLTIGIFMICWFFGAAILGDLSDKIGRKRSLMICLFGSFLGYFISAIAILAKSFPLLIIGRMVAGFTAGSQPIAQAAIVDVSTDEDKAKNIGFILLSVSLGFVLGPLLGGVLSEPSFVSWFNFQTPMYFAAFLSLVNAFLLYVLFKETYLPAKDNKISIKLSMAVDIVKEAFKHPKIKFYSLVLLVMIFGWSNYFTFINLYLTQMYHYTALKNSLFLATMGLGFSLGCGKVVNYCSKHYELINTVVVTLLLTALEILITILFKAESVAWVMTLCIGVTLSVAYSSLLAVFSNCVSANEQGWVMGVTGSIMAICFGLTSVLTGLIAQMGAILPMVLAFSGIAISALMLGYKVVR